MTNLPVLCTCHCCTHRDEYEYVAFSDLPEGIDESLLGHVYQAGILVRSSGRPL